MAKRVANKRVMVPARRPTTPVRAATPKAQANRAKRGLKSKLVAELMPNTTLIKSEPKPGAANAHVGNKRTRDFGIYECGLISEEEKDIFEDLSLESLDYEIKMVRLRLRRAYAADAIQNKLLSDEKTRDQALMMNKHVRTLTPEGIVVSRERVLKDYGVDCHRLEKTLMGLIQVRNQILIGTANENDELSRIEARRKAAVAMDRLFSIVSDKEMEEAKADLEKAAQKAERFENDAEEEEES